MNPIVVIAVIWCLITIGSSCILYFSFKSKVDLSGRYFLLSESLIASNVYPETQNHVVYVIGYGFFIAAGISVAFSIATLTKNVKVSNFFISISIGVLYSILMELCRRYNPVYPTLLFAVASFVIALITYQICNSVPDPELKSNLFLKWIKYIQVALFCFAGLRFLSILLGYQISAENPSPQLSLIYSINAALNIFRYIAYQSLRISWIDPKRNLENPLNRNLSKIAAEKDLFIHGLISSNRALGISALANSLAHQLSQPITGIILQTESVKRDLKEQKGQESSIRTLDTVTGELSRLSELVGSLRQLFNSKELEFQSIDLQKTCKAVLEIIEPALKSKNINLVAQFESCPKISGNAAQIQQVLINLLNNASDAIVASDTLNKEIHLTVSADNNHSIISIQDTGSGIKPEIQPTLFELYKTTKPDGLGIGLWLCKEIIERHGGIITAANSKQGGAIFEIKLKLSQEPRNA
jgi:signal transduction histidine kinase